MANRTLFLGGLGLVVILAAFVSPFASSSPDGLEAVAERQAIAAAEPPALSAAPLADYALPGATRTGVATGAAGVIGTLVVLALGALLARVLVARRQA